MFGVFLASDAFTFTEIKTLKDKFIEASEFTNEVERLNNEAMIFNITMLLDTPVHLLEQDTTGSDLF